MEDIIPKAHFSVLMGAITLEESYWVKMDAITRQVTFLGRMDSINQQVHFRAMMVDTILRDLSWVMMDDIIPTAHF